MNIPHARRIALAGLLDRYAAALVDGDDARRDHVRRELKRRGLNLTLDQYAYRDAPAPHANPAMLRPPL